MHIFGCEILYIRIYTDTYSYTILALENVDFLQLEFKGGFQTICVIK